MRVEKIVKHLEKILFVISLGFYAWGIIDDRVMHWTMIGGLSAFLMLIASTRKNKGQPIMDINMMLMIAAVVVLVGTRILDSIRG